MLNFSLDNPYLNINQNPSNSWKLEASSNKPKYKDCGSALGTLKDLKKYLYDIREQNDESLLTTPKQYAQYVTKRYIIKLGWTGRLYNVAKRFFGFKVEQDEILALNEQIQRCMVSSISFPNASHRDVLNVVFNNLFLKDLLQFARVSKFCYQAVRERLYQDAQKKGYPDDNQYNKVILYLKVFKDFSLLNSKPQSLELGSSSAYIILRVVTLFFQPNSNLVPNETLSFIKNFLKKNTQHPSYKIFYKHFIYYIPIPEVQQDAYLHRAISQNALDLAQHLVRRGVDINAAHKEKGTPLEFAIITNRKLEIIQKLLDFGADPKIRQPLHILFESLYTYTGDRPKWQATDEDKAIAQLLIKNGADLNALYKSRCSTILERAIIKGDTEAIQFFLDLGADPKYKNPLFLLFSLSMLYERDSCLQIPNFKKIAQLLINHGADINALNEHNKTLLEKSIYHNRDFKFIQMLIELGADPKKGNILESITSKEILILLLDNGVDIQSFDWRNLEKWSYEAIKEIIERGVILNWQQALETTVCLGVREVLELLIQHGADVNFVFDKNTLGIANETTILDYAIRLNQVEIVDCLIQNRADLAAGFPLIHAAFNGNIEIANILLREGINMNPPFVEDTSWTALTFAIEENHLKMVEWLLDHHANPFFGASFKTLIEYKRVEIAEIFVQRGINPTIKASEGSMKLNLWIASKKREELKVDVITEPAL